MKKYLKEKREEFIWHLEDQGYSYGDIAELFSDNIYPVKVMRIVQSRPKNWKPKWIKQE